MFMKTTLLAAAAVLSFATASSAAGIFSDDFNGEALQLNATLDKWTVDPGAVDVIGTGSFDFYPGNGNYLDMNGSNGAASEGTITTAGLGLEVGKRYELSFDYGTNDAPGAFPVLLTFGLGTLSETLTILAQPDFLMSAIYTFVYDGSGDFLFFADTSGTSSDQGGPVLDNVSLAAVPLPAGGLLLLGALGGFAALRRRKTA